jgi:Pro-kumamolisin, activation domain
VRLGKLLGRLGRSKVVVVMVTGLAVLGAVAPGRGFASASHPAGMRRSRLAPSVPAGASAVGALVASTPIDLAVALAPRDEAALTSFIAAASTPGSPAYHHYLAPGQFASRFGPASTTIAGVQDELHSLGIAATTVSSDHLFVKAVTTAVPLNIEGQTLLKRFHKLPVTLTVALASNGKTIRAVTRELIIASKTTTTKTRRGSSQTARAASGSTCLTASRSLFALSAMSPWLGCERASCQLSSGTLASCPGLQITNR